MIKNLHVFFAKTMVFLFMEHNDIISDIITLDVWINRKLLTIGIEFLELLSWS